MPCNGSEATRLICRFLNGDLPLFALEAWLQEAELTGWDSTELTPLPTASDARWQALAARLQPLLQPGELENWRAQRALNWVRSNEPRASLAVAELAALAQAGLAPLNLFVGVLREGEQTTGFDWERVKAQVPELQSAADLLLHALEQGTLRLEGPAQWQLGAELAAVLPAQADPANWRQTAAALHDWQATHQQLLPVQA
ncbi:MAG: hypothetical protein ACO1RX_08150 [Candidatus Sericytochromatia bacterium]